jgi:hypothetical protein
MPQAVVFFIGDVTKLKWFSGGSIQLGILRGEHHMESCFGSSNAAISPQYTEYTVRREMLVSHYNPEVLAPVTQDMHGQYQYQSDNPLSLHVHT